MVGTELYAHHLCQPWMLLAMSLPQQKNINFSKLEIQNRGCGQLSSIVCMSVVVLLIIIYIYIVCYTVYFVLLFFLKGVHRELYLNT